MKRINQVSLNIIMNILSFLVVFLINFFTTPYITQNAGMEAYGFVGLANNFTSYITIVTTALNSMASRFITIQIHKHNTEEANRFFNSALFANTAFAVIVMIFSIGLVLNINSVLVISPELVHDVQVTFFLVFLTFAASLAFSVFNVSYYAQNALSVGAWKTIESNIIRAIIICLLFNFVGVKIQYTVIATFLSTLYAQIYSIRFTKLNNPEIKVSIHYFTKIHFFEMVKAGIWNSISKLSQVLMNGLDLIITNLYISGPILGSVSVAKTFANIVISIIASVSDAFLPSFLKSFSENPDDLENSFFESTQVMGYFSAIILTAFCVYCEEFYMLWLPGEDAVLLRNLTWLSILSVAVSGPLYAMFSIYTVINKVKPMAVAGLVTAVLSTLTVFILLSTTNLGVYAIVGVSSFYGIAKNLTYNMYCLRKYADISPMKCYVILAKNILLMLVAIGILMYFKKWFRVTSYYALMANGMISVLFVSVLYFVFILNKPNKEKVIGKILSAVGRGR